MAINNFYQFEKHLHNEFAKLGFNYDEVKGNGLDYAGEDKIKMYAFDYLKELDLHADGLAVIFTINFSPDKDNPIIEEMNARLFKESSIQKLTSLITQKHIRSEKELPTKKQLLVELKDSLKIKTIREKFKIGKGNQDLKQGQNEGRKRNRIYK